MVTYFDRSTSGAGQSGFTHSEAHGSGISSLLKAMFQHSQPSIAQAPPTAPAAPCAEKPLRRPAGTAGKWKKQQAAAALHWPRISEAELQWSDGHVVRLVGLVQQRYQISQANAERQVQRFFELNAC